MPQILFLYKGAKRFYYYQTFKNVNKIILFSQDTLVMTEEQLDVSLAKVCMGFDTMTYAKIQVKYDLRSFNHDLFSRVQNYFFFEKRKKCKN